MIPAASAHLLKNGSVVEKVNFRFRLISIVALLFLSLMGGFVWELRKGPSTAEATISPLASSMKDWRPRLIVVPSTLLILPIGDKSEINGRPSESAVFQSNADVKSLSQSIVKEWELQGYLTSGVAFNDRGAAFGTSKDGRIRSSLGIWKNPKTAKTEGVISASEITPGKDQSDKSFIPGFQVPPNSKLGATYKSTENGEISWTGSVTASGSAESVAKWYSRALLSSGWKSVESPNSKFLQFNRKDEEVTLLFADIPNESETFISVIKKSGQREP